MPFSHFPWRRRRRVCCDSPKWLHPVVFVEVGAFWTSATAVTVTCSFLIGARSVASLCSPSHLTPFEEFVMKKASKSLDCVSRRLLRVWNPIWFLLYSPPRGYYLQVNEASLAQTTHSLLLVELWAVVANLAHNFARNSVSASTP